MDIIKIQKKKKKEKIISKWYSANWKFMMRIYFLNHALSRKCLLVNLLTFHTKCTLTSPISFRFIDSSDSSFDAKDEEDESEADTSEKKKDKKARKQTDTVGGFTDQEIKRYARLFAWE